MRPETPRGLDESLSQLLEALERASGAAETCALQHLLASLERLKAIVWARVLSLANPTTQTHTEPLEDLRHLTPIQVAECLGLKAAYVHELCRARRIPAIKQGKYWMIPVGELREWLARSRQGLDPRRAVSLPWPDRPDPATPSSRGRSLRRRPLDSVAGRRPGTGARRRHDEVASTEAMAGRAEEPDSR